MTPSTGGRTLSQRKRTITYAVAACLLLVGGFACNSTDTYLGTYEATDNTGGTQKQICIELLENGEGSWTCCDNEVLFTWYARGGELRINTKEGGTMVGRFSNQSFTITLPGSKQLTFVKLPPQ